MKYNKPFRTFDEQADILLQRGLVAEKAELVRHLEQVNYYRLSAYWHPFRQRDPADPTGENRLDDITPGTTFAKVWRRYTFDRQLRIIVMDAIERVEVSMRTRLVYLMSRDYGKFGYANPANFNLRVVSPDKKVFNLDHPRFLYDLGKSVDRSAHEVFISHYHRKYASEKYLPMWMLSEVIPFGTMFTMVKHLKPPLQGELAAEFDVSADVLVSWLTTLNYIRNLCAHHSRFYNRELAIKPFMPRPNKYPEWHKPVQIAPNRIFGVLTVLRYLMNRIAPQSGWTCRLMRLLNRYGEVPLLVMGFPEDWCECPIWHNCHVLDQLAGVEVEL